MSDTERVSAERAEQVRQHVRRLHRGSKAPLAAIAEASGLGKGTVWRTLHEQRRPYRRCADALLAVTLADVQNRANPAAMVPIVGARRRLQALMAIDWSRAALTDLLGADAVEVLRQRRTLVSRDIHDAVVELYRRQQHTAGPSANAGARARGMGYLPPLAWAGVDIDNPTARPHEAATPADGSAEALRLLAGGRTLVDAAAGAGVKVDSVIRAAERSPDRSVRRLVVDAKATARADQTERAS